MRDAAGIGGFEILYMILRHKVRRRYRRAGAFVPQLSVDSMSSNNGYKSDDESDGAMREKHLSEVYEDNV